VTRSTEARTRAGSVLPHVTTTKLRPPFLRPGLLERSELLEMLRDGEKARLTLVCAPAGYGKTTLLAQWEAANREDTAFVWVSLDERDSDPMQLWSHVISGLHLCRPSVGDASLTALAGGPNSVAGSVVPLLVDELAQAQPLVLVLEDWHAVRSPLCDETMSLFVERMPTHHQVVVSTRSDPAWPIARMRAHGDLAEIRARDLRISAAEAGVLFRDGGVRLTAREVRRLTERTEGWLAGLSLALLVLREQDDPTSFVLEFSGDSRLVFDYLASDVLAGVDPDVRDFMLRSSVLDRVSAPLCDAVLERADSAAVIAEIERENLFLVALDETGLEYRYHNLFATVLRRELEATAPLSVGPLHERASRWYEEHGDVEHAIEHAIASRDAARASALIMGVAVQLLSAGRMATVNRWFGLLSWPEAMADRELAAMRALSARLSGLGRDVVERWLAVAEDGPDYGPLANGITSISSVVAMVSSAYLSRGIADAEQSARLVLDVEPSGSVWRYAGLVPLGQALYLAGRNEDARVPLDEARKLPGANQRATTILALAYLALIELAAGDVEAATSLAERALATANEIGHASTPAAGNAHMALGCVLMRGTDLRSALEHLERAVTLTSSDVASHWHAHALLHLAAARHRMGESDSARDALARARAELDELPDVGMLGELYHETDEAIHRPARREGYLGQDLSAAESRILTRLLEGLSVTEVAHELWLSPNTVKTHRRGIYRKLGVTTRDELMARATELGLDARVKNA
jgi:LuxR family transcriptional regulator, maltose regulon positive regulatory protein